MAAAACGAVLLTSTPAFVSSVQTSSSAIVSPVNLRGANFNVDTVPQASGQQASFFDVQAASSSASGGSSVLCKVAAFGAAAVVASSLRSSTTRTGRRAEPVSAAMAAAAAAKAAAASGAVKTAGAVAGSATTGTLKKSSEDQVFDEELDKRKMMPTDRGTPEYERYMKQKKAQWQTEWDARTSRDGESFGQNAGARKDGDLYDILETTNGAWSGIGSPTDFDPALQVGAMEPLGYFDPLGFCKDKGAENFYNFRCAEIKHGRVAMMAAVGAVVQHYVKFPGFQDVPSGLAAVNVAPGSYAAIALIGVSGVLELGVWTEKGDKIPGNFGDPLGLDQYTREMRERELNNGRMAMFAAIGIIVAELYTGLDAIEQFGL